MRGLIIFNHHAQPAFSFLTQYINKKKNTVCQEKFLFFEKKFMNLVVK